MDPDLVGPTGLERERELGEVRIHALHPVSRRGEASAARHHREFLPVAGAPGQRRLDSSFLLRHPTPDERPVEPLHLARLELARELAVRDVVSRDEEEAGGALVDAVNDPCALDPRGAGKGAVAMEQCVDERTGAVPHRGVDHHPRGLRDHGERVVLVYDRERDVLGEELRRDAARARDLDHVPRLDAPARAGRSAVHAHASGVDQLLDRGARERVFDLR